MNFAPTLPIETERLTLRAFTRGDVDAVFAYRQREDVARYLFDGPMSYESCAETVQARIGQVALAAENDRITLAVVRRADDVLVGEITLIWRSVVSHQGEVGFVFNPEFHGQGYALEAVRALVALGFGTVGLHRIYARCDPRNAPSYRLMERLGMRREAHFREQTLLKGEWTDEYIYALLARDWPGDNLALSTA
jgi:RimJ/RimL family protein N-acetyltransferase